MKRGAIGAIVTVLLATAAAASVFLYVQSARDRAEGGIDMTDVIVSTVDIPAGEKLDALIERDVFRKKSIPTNDLVQGVLTDVYQLRGQRTAYPILAGEQISAARLEGALQAAGGLLGIPSGMQAASVTLDGQRAVAGKLREGDHVEVYGTFRKSSQDAWITRVLVVDAEVLAVNANPETVGQSEATVTLAVTPYEAQLLIYGQEQSRIWLTLLPPNEAGVEQPPVRSVGSR